MGRKVCTPNPTFQHHEGRSMEWGGVVNRLLQYNAKCSMTHVEIKLFSSVHLGQLLLSLGLLVRG